MSQPDICLTFVNGTEMLNTTPTTPEKTPSKEMMNTTSTAPEKTPSKEMVNTTSTAPEKTLSKGRAVELVILGLCLISAVTTVVVVSLRQPTTTFKIVEVVGEIFIKEQWPDKLADHTSPEYQAKKRAIETELDRAFKAGRLRSVYDRVEVELVGLRPGSIVVEITVSVNIPPGGATFENSTVHVSVEDYPSRVDIRGAVRDDITNAVNLDVDTNRISVRVFVTLKTTTSSPVATTTNSPVPAATAAPYPASPLAAGWTKWLDRDTPSAAGERETVADFKTRPCKGLPTWMQVRVKGESAIIASVTERITVGPDFGLRCKNVLQRDRYCLDYYVHYMVPKMSRRFNRDLPSATGDWELKSAEKGSDWKSGQFIYWYADDNNYGFASDRLDLGPRYGLSCENLVQKSDKLCADYQVRFYC